MISTSTNNRHDWICRAVLLLVCLAVWAPRFAGPINFRWDASTYYILGTALAEGKGYRLLNEPGEIPAVQYPPLLPVIVAAHQWVMRTSDYFKVGFALRISYCMLSFLFSLMAFALARRFLAPLYALLVVVIAILSLGSFLFPSEVLYAEMPFAVVALAFLLCQQKNGLPFFAVASGLFGIAAYLLRTAGITLLLAWIAEALIRGRLRQALVRGAIAALPVLLWQFYVWHVTHSYEYQHPAYSYQRATYYYSNVTYSENSRLVDPFRPELGQVSARDVAERLVRNAVLIPIALGESSLTPKWFAWSLLKRVQNLQIPFSRGLCKINSVAFSCGLLAVGLLALGGAILVATGPQWFLSLYFGINVTIIAITPWQNQFWRYLAPMTPVTLIFVFVMLFTIRRWLESRYPGWCRRAVVTAVPAMIMLLVQMVMAIHLFRSMGLVSYYDIAGHRQTFKLVDYPSEWHELDSAFEWIRRNAVPGTVIASTVPHLGYLRSGHKAVLPPFEPDSDTAMRELDGVPVSYLVTDRFRLPGISERYAAPVVTERPQYWQLVFTAADSETRVYARVR